MKGETNNHLEVADMDNEKENNVAIINIPMK